MRRLHVVVAMLCAGSAARATEPIEEALVRMGGEVAVPLPERGVRAPDQVLIAPAGGPAVARTEGGSFVVWDARRGAPVVVPLRGDKLLGASPNGGSLLTGGADGKVTRWRVGSWRQVTELQVEGAVEEAHYSSDGHHIVVASAGPDGRRFTLFGGAVGLALKRLDRDDARALAPIAVASSRMAFPVKDDHVIALYSLPRFEGLREVALEGDDPLRALAFASETELVGVIGGAPGRIVRWNTESGKVLSEVRLPERCARLALAGDGKLALCAPSSEKGQPVNASLVDSQTGAVRSTFRVPGRGAPVFDPGGLRVAFPGNGAMPIWEVTIDGVNTTLPAGSVAGAVRQLVIVGQTVVALEDGIVRAWDPETLAEAWRLTSDATGIAVLGTRLALAGPSGLALYDPATGAVVGVDKKAWQAVAGAGETVVLLDASGRVMLRGPGEKRARAALGKARKERGMSGVLALAWDGSAFFAEGRLGALPPPRRLGGEVVTQTARAAVWLGARLVVVEGDAPRVVRGAGAAFPALPGLSAIAASPDGLWLALGSADGRVLIYDQSGALRLERVAHHGAITAIAFDLTKHRIYTAGESGGQSLVLGWSLP